MDCSRWFCPNAVAASHGASRSRHLEMTAASPYKILGVKRDSSLQAIRKAYKGLARKYHPDVNPGDKAAEERFKRITEAYGILSDPEKRRAYDQFGAAGEGQGPVGGNPSGFAAGAHFQGDLGDLFSQIFGQQARRPGRAGPLQGADVEAVMRVGFMDAIRGLETPVCIQRQGACSACRTGGSRSCRECGGSGLQYSSQTIEVRIPAGVSDGTRLRIAGQGHAGTRGGRAGDLRVSVRVDPHPVFTRQGDNILCTVPVTISEAAMGARIHVPTVDGSAVLNVPPGTQGGQQLRLKGKGVPSRRGGRGDQLVEVRVLTPDARDESVRQLLQELASLLPAPDRDELIRQSEK